MTVSFLKRISITFSFAFAIASLLIAIGSTIQVERAYAADFQMQTGYYMGNGGTLSITGLGFQPDFVIIKSDTTAGVAVFKTSAMPTSNTAFFSATADNTGSNLILNADGFTVGALANVNNVNVRYTWSAFSGSDCTASGTFCVGTYTGNGAATRNISTGFAPDAVIVKRSNNIAAHFHTTSHPTNRTSYFTTTADNTAGAFIQDLIADGFRVSSTGDNVNGGVYYYIAFKNTAGIFRQGGFTAPGGDNINVTGAGFVPDLVIAKNSTSGTTANRNPAMSSRDHYGDHSVSLGATTATAVNIIQALQTDGFQIGSDVRVNDSGQTIYVMVFGGAPPRPSGSGSFVMESGSYTGNGSSLAISGLSFAPDLVMIKHDGTQRAVFRTSLMQGDITAYMDINTTDFANGITSLTSSGFTLGNSNIVNQSGQTYHWQAFGNAYNPVTNTGASDFAIGVYTGNTIDNRDITALSWQPDFVEVKRNAGSAAVIRSSSQAGDLSVPLGATAEAANNIQALNTTGFQVGTNAQVNTTGLYRWFAFKEGSTFDVGSYTGNATDNRNITDVGFHPDLVWVKRTTAVAGVLRPGTIMTDLTQRFLNQANFADRIQTLISNGFQIGGNQTETNASGGIYRFVAWDGKRYDQRGYRLFQNANSTNVGSPLAAQNTTATLASSGDGFRLRMLMRVDGGNLFASGRQFKLQFAERVGTCDVNFSGESYADVTGSTVIAYNNNAAPADGAGLTNNANDPTDGARTIVNQTYEEANNFTNPTLIKGTYEGTSYAGQTGKWDFSLIDNSAPAGTSFCFRIVNTDGTPINSYFAIPEIATAAPAPDSLSFSISDNTVGFGTLSAASARYATGDLLGSGSETVAHTISASTNGASGYVITVRGSTLQYGAEVINAIGGTAAASAPGTEQFGIRITSSGGNGVAIAPYNHASNYGYAATESVADEIASDPDGDDVATTYSVRYIANVAPTTAAGDYDATLTYIITAGF